MSEGAVAAEASELRVCSKCHTEWPNGAYQRHHLGKGGLRSECNTCRAARVRSARHRRPERHIRVLMIQRCHNPNSPKFHHYGGRGIEVCQRWRESFDAFLEDMGPRPSPEHEIDRIDNDGNYEPGNCRWATRREQMENTRRTRLVTIDGETKCIARWGRELGVSTFKYRINRGESPEDAARPTRGRERIIEYQGERMNQAQWSERLGGRPTLVVTRLLNGWTEEEAVSTPVGGRRARRT